MLGEFLAPKSRTLLEKAETVGLCFAFNFVWTVCVLYVLRTVGPSSIIAPEVFYSCLFAPLWEELAFRFVPISIARRAGREVMIPVIVASSIIFGILHGGYLNILIQGVGGFALSLVYIRNGYCYWSAVAAHALWNWMLVIGLPSLIR